MRTSLTLALVAILIAVAAPEAGAKTVVGPATLATTGLTNEPCGTPVCTFVQFSDGGATPSYVSPVTGVITGWRLASGSAGNPVRLRVLRPGPTAGTFSGVGTGLAHTTEAGLNTFTTERLFIQAGESIGLDDAQGLFFSTGLTGALVRWWSPAVGDGTGPSAPTNASAAGHSLQLNADVEPDADGDRFGDETQDACPGDVNHSNPPCATGPTQKILPIVTQLRVSPHSLRIGGHTSISFRISKASRWTLRFEQGRPGRIRSGRCRLQTKKLRKGGRCTFYRSRGTVSGNGGPGKVTLIFQGSLANKRAIPAGRYRVTARAKDSVGTSAPVRAALTLRPKPKRKR